ncbi:MAG TPA: hypothetical protein VMR14_09360 [Streptosporangiaceae bacterium]|nr:hypothetical protein [Streptosporangiaceae bacterium]
MKAEAARLAEAEAAHLATAEAAARRGRATVVAARLARATAAARRRPCLVGRTWRAPPDLRMAPRRQAQAGAGRR